MQDTSARGQVVQSIDTTPLHHDFPDWVYEAALAITERIRKNGLEHLDCDFGPIEIPSLSDDASDSLNLENLWAGNRDVLALNWTIESPE